MDSLPVNITDILVAVVLILSGLLAFMRGFVHEVLSIAAWVGAGFGALYGFPMVRPFARDIIAQELIADIAAGAVVFLILLVILTIITKMISGRVQESALNALDRSLGFLFGVARGAVIVCLAWIAVDWAISEESQPTWLTEARTLPFIQDGAAFLKDLAPEELIASTRDTANEARETQQTFDKLLSPEAAPDPSQGEADGYSDRVRRNLDRLIENNQ